VVALTPDSLAEAFHELGTRAAAEGKVIDLAVYGGSCLMLASNFRIATRDVDAVPISEPGVLVRLAAEVAAALRLPDDWLNDGVRTYLSAAASFPDHHLLLRGYPNEAAPGLRVFVPTAEYLLAMKLMAMRVDEAEGAKDLEDLRHLMRVVGVRDKADLVAFASAFYPEARTSGKLMLSLDRLWQAHQADDGTHDPPRYLGRSAPPGNGG
jgi:hypothetical protein